MKDRKELVYDLAGALVAIFIGCIIFIVIIVNIPGTNAIDGALIANVFTGGVTLYAPIAAYYLLNNWKDQKKYDLNKELLLEIDNILYSIHEEIGQHARIAETLKNINTQKVRLEKSLENRRFYFTKEINSLYQKCTLFDALNQSKLENEQFNFGLAVFRLGIALEKIYAAYQQYVTILNIQNSHLTCTSKYINNENKNVLHQINQITQYLTNTYDFSIENKDGTIKKEVKLTYDELHTDLNESYAALREKIISYITL